MRYSALPLDFDGEHAARVELGCRVDLARGLSFHEFERIDELSHKAVGPFRGSRASKRRSVAARLPLRLTH